MANLELTQSVTHVIINTPPFSDYFAVLRNITAQSSAHTLALTLTEGYIFA